MEGKYTRCPRPPLELVNGKPIWIHQNGKYAIWFNGQQWVMGSKDRQTINFRRPADDKGPDEGSWNYGNKLIGFKSRYVEVISVS